MENEANLTNNIIMNTNKLHFAQICGFIFLCMLALPAVCFAADKTDAYEALLLREHLIDEAHHYLGTPYKYGARGPNYFDCSGFIRYVANKSCDLNLPSTSHLIYKYAKVIPENEREVGDLLFFKREGDAEISHVGIYLGGNQFIHAASEGPNTGVIISTLNERYWKRNYYATGQILPSANVVVSLPATNAKEVVSTPSAKKSIEPISDLEFEVVDFNTMKELIKNIDLITLE